MFTCTIIWGKGLDAVHSPPSGVEKVRCGVVVVVNLNIVITSPPSTAENAESTTINFKKL